MHSRSFYVLSNADFGIPHCNSGRLYTLNIVCGIVPLPLLSGSGHVWDLVFALATACPAVVAFGRFPAVLLGGNPFPNVLGCHISSSGCIPPLCPLYGNSRSLCLCFATNPRLLPVPVQSLRFSLLLSALLLRLVRHEVPRAPCHHLGFSLTFSVVSVESAVVPWSIASSLLTCALERGPSLFLWSFSAATILLICCRSVSSVT